MQRCAFPLDSTCPTHAFCMYVGHWMCFTTPTNVAMCCWAHEPGPSILATALPTLSLLPLHLPAPAQAYTARWSRWTIAITFRPTRSRGMPYWPVADSFTKSQQRARSSSIALNELVDLRTQIRIRFYYRYAYPSYQSSVTSVFSYQTISYQLSD